MNHSISTRFIHDKAVNNDDLCMATQKTLLYFFFCIVLLHLVLLLSKAKRILSYQPPPLRTRKSGFSVVVAAHNEAENLKTLIPGLLAQAYPDFEVIIALDRCTDTSHQVIKAALAKHPDKAPLLKVLELKDKPAATDGKKHALTTAIQAASKDWALLTDADCRPSSAAWIAAFNEHITPDAEILLGVSPYGWRTGLLNAVIRYETFLTALQYISAALAGKAYMGVGRNLAYRKTLFTNGGGFKGFESLTGGDDDLFVQKFANRLNTKVVLTQESLTYSAAKRRFTEYLTQKTRHLSVGKYYRSKLKNSHAFRSAVHAMVWVSFLYLIFSGSSDMLTIGVFCSLVVIKGLVFTKTASKMNTSMSMLWLPIVDFLYAVMLPLIGIRAVFVKNIRWK